MFVFEEYCLETGPMFAGRFVAVSPNTHTDLWNPTVQIMRCLRVYAGFQFFALHVSTESIQLLSLKLSLLSSLILLRV